MSYNFKSIADVEVVAEPTESANVLIEENGVIKRVHKDEVGGGVKKELIYEWNFSADDEVTEIIENVDDDLTWLLEKSDTVGWEMEFITYAQYDAFNDDGVYYDTVTDDTLTTVTYATDTNYSTQYCSNGYMSSCAYGDGPEDFRNYWNKDYYSTGVYAYVYNKVHVDDSWEASETDVGGCIYIYQDYSSPFKSVKIYKVLR